MQQCCIKREKSPSEEEGEYIWVDARAITYVCTTYETPWERAIGQSLGYILVDYTAVQTHANPENRLLFVVQISCILAQLSLSLPPSLSLSLSLSSFELVSPCRAPFPSLYTIFAPFIFFPPPKYLQIHWSPQNSCKMLRVCTTSAHDTFNSRLIIDRAEKVSAALAACIWARIWDDDPMGWLAEWSNHSFPWLLMHYFALHSPRNSTHLRHSRRTRAYRKLVKFADIYPRSGVYILHVEYEG